MSNNKPMCDDTLANKGALDHGDLIRASDDLIQYTAEWLVNNYVADWDYDDTHTYEYFVNEHINEMKSNPYDVGICYTSTMETDTDTWEEFGDEHEVQFSYDLVNMKWKLYLDNELIHEDDLDENKWGVLYGTGYDELCGDLFDLCNEYAPLPDEHEYC